MYISPVSFNSYIRQNNNCKQNVSFQAAIDKNNINYQKLINSGFKLWNNNVNLITPNGNVSGAAFVKDSKYDIETIITDDKFDSVGRADATLYDDYAEVYIVSYRNRNEMK